MENQGITNLASQGRQQWLSNKSEFCHQLTAETATLLVSPHLNEQLHQSLAKGTRFGFAHSSTQSGESDTDLDCALVIEELAKDSTASALGSLFSSPSEVPSGVVVATSVAVTSVAARSQSDTKTYSFTSSLSLTSALPSSLSEYAPNSLNEQPNTVNQNLPTFISHPETSHTTVTGDKAEGTLQNVAGAVTQPARPVPRQNFSRAAVQSSSAGLKPEQTTSPSSAASTAGVASVSYSLSLPGVNSLQLTSDGVMKQARRRERNRLATRRYREKRQKCEDMLVEENRKLQFLNSELEASVEDLTVERDNIVLVLRQLMKQCLNYNAIQIAANGLSQKVLDLLGFPSLFVSEADVQGVSDLCVITGDSCSCHSRSQSTSLVVRQEQSDFYSCLSSPLMGGVNSQLIKVKDTSMPGATICYDESSSLTNHSLSLQSPQAGDSFSLDSPQLDSPPLSCTVPRLLPPPRSRTQATSTNSSSTVDVMDEEEVIQYQHKLMKHRKHFSQASSSSFVGSRTSLEHSFSFPCTVRESRSNCDSPAGSESYMLRP